MKNTEFENLIKENEFLKAQVKKLTQARASMFCAIFYASFISVALFIYCFFDLFKENSGIFMIEILFRAFAMGFSLLLWGMIQKVLFGDPLKDYADNLYPHIEKDKETKLTILLVALLYITQLIGYFIFVK